MSQLSHAQFPLRRHPDLLVDHRRARSAAVAEPRGANVESRDRLRWPASFRNGGRNQIGTVADIKSESPAGLPRNSQFGNCILVRLTRMPRCASVRILFISNNAENFLPPFGFTDSRPESRRSSDSTRRFGHHELPLALK